MTTLEPTFTAPGCTSLLHLRELYGVEVGHDLICALAFDPDDVRAFAPDDVRAFARARRVPLEDGDAEPSQRLRAVERGWLEA